MIFSAEQLFGVFITVFLFVLCGVYSGRRVKTAEDFTVSGKRAGGLMVAGTILGTMIGGASTIGTAQMAFAGGLSAWWFTLGGGISCLFYCLFLVKPVREHGQVTIPGIIGEVYGQQTALAATIFITLGMIINIIPQLISAASLVSSFFSLSFSLAAVFAVLLMAVYVCFGGAWGTGMLGVLKTILISLSLLAGGAAALWLTGGPSGMSSELPSFPWFSFCRAEISDDISSLFCLILGVLTGQVYLQAVMTAKSTASARRGTIISAVLSPLIGLGGVLIGLFMRSRHPEIMAVQALPLFVLWYLPGWLSGVVLAALFFAVIGTGAGLALGICTIISRDIYQKLFPAAGDAKTLKLNRTLLFVLFASALFVVQLIGEKTMIFDWSYLSLGFRGVSAFFPMLTTLYLPGKINPQAVFLASILGPATVVIWLVAAPWPVEPIYPALLVCLVLFLAGYLQNKKEATDILSYKSR